MQGEPAEVLVLGPEPPGLAGATWLRLVEIEPVEGCSLRVLAVLGEADALAFTSPRAPRVLADDARSHGVLERLLGLARRVRVLAVGPSTARAVREALGVEPLVPRSYSVAGLAELARTLGVRVLVAPRAAEAATRLSELLEARVHEIPCYRVRVSEQGLRRLRERLLRGGRIALIVSSPLIAEAVCRAVAGTGARPVLVAFRGPSLERVKRLCPGLTVAVPPENTYEAAVETARRLLGESV